MSDQIGNQNIGFLITRLIGVIGGGQAEEKEGKMAGTTASLLVEEVTIDRDVLIGVIVAIVIV